MFVFSPRHLHNKFRAVTIEFKLTICISEKVYCPIVIFLLLCFQNFFCGSDKPDDAWVPYYKKFFNNIVHFAKLETTLHKGDFCINTSLLVPGHLIIRYHDAGIIRSLPLEGEDFPVMWRKDWCEKMRNEMKGRFLFLNCVVNTKRGLERRPWRYLMSEFGNVSTKQFKGELMKIGHHAKAIAFA